MSAATLNYDGCSQIVQKGDVLDLSEDRDVSTLFDSDCNVGKLFASMTSMFKMGLISDGLRNDFKVHQVGLSFFSH